MKDNKGDKKDKTDDTWYYVLWIFLFIIVIIILGTIGYHLFEGLEWIDSFHNGVLVFTLTGEIVPTATYNGKLFSSLYNIISLFSFILIAIGVGYVITQNNKE